MNYLVILIIISILGFLLSLYGLYIEAQLERNPAYKPICDISDSISCSKPFGSPYSKLFGISNSYLGVIFYPVLGLLMYLGRIDLVFYLSLVAVGVSFYLAYHLYFTIRSFCLLCNMFYVINILLLLFSYLLRQ